MIRTAMIFAAVSSGVVSLSGCSGGSSSDGGSISASSSTSSTSVPSFSIGGFVNGLSGTGLVLQNNGGNDLTLSANGAFTFTTPVANGNAYSVTIKIQPAATPAQSCTVTGGSGLVPSAAVTSVTVNCHTLVGKFLYVLNNGGANGISAYVINANTGALTPVAGSPFIVGNARGGLNFDPAEKIFYVSNLSTLAGPIYSYAISGFAINDVSGALTEVAGSPFQLSGIVTSLSNTMTLSPPVFHPTRKFAYFSQNFTDDSPSLLHGATVNSITGDLTTIVGSPFMVGSTSVGAGGLAFNAKGTRAYLPNTIKSPPNGAQQGRINVYSVDVSSGALSIDSMAPSISTNGSSPIVASLHPSGQFLYVPNLLSGNIAAFSINATSGALTAIPGSPYATDGTWPLYAVVHPSGKFLYVANSNSFPSVTTMGVAAYAIDATTGGLSSIVGSPFLTNGTESSSQVSVIRMDSTGKFLYVLNRGTNSIEGYSINQGSGALTEISGAPFNTEMKPSSMIIDPSGKYMYVTNTAYNSVSSYVIDASTGAITLIETVAAGNIPNSVVVLGSQ